MTEVDEELIQARVAAHAREWAAGVLASIEVDMQTGASTRFSDEVDDVSAREEWRSARPELKRSLRKYDEIWLEAFSEALAEGARVRCIARAKEVVQDHLGFQRGRNVAYGFLHTSGTDRKRPILR